MKKWVFFWVLFCCSQPGVLGELIEIENVTFSVELVVKDNCSSIQEDIFLIERVNYSSGDEAVTVSYSTVCYNRESNISKDVKKYSTSKTGSCLFNESGNYTLTFVDLLHNFTWNKEIVCGGEEEKENSTNETTLDLELNQTIEYENESVDLEYELVMSSLDSTTICYQKAELILNEELFKEDEQLTMDFSLDNISDNVEIEYWIETINGSMLKNKRVTQNLNTKKHTFKTIKETEQGAYVKAIIRDECSTLEIKQLILLLGEEEQQQKQEAEITIRSLKQTISQSVLLELDVQRGDEKSPAIFVEVKDIDNNKMYEELILLEEKQSQTHIETYLPTFFEKEIIITIKGMGLEVEEQIILEIIPLVELENTYTKQTYYTNEITWYVRTKQSQPILIEINSSNITTYSYVSKLGESTTAIKIPYFGEEIITTLYQGTYQHSQRDLPLLKKREISPAPLDNIEEHKHTSPFHIVDNQKDNITSAKKEVNLLLLENNTPSTPETKESKSFFVRKEALYGLLGVILAGSAYFLLKE